MFNVNLLWQPSSCSDRPKSSARRLGAFYDETIRAGIYFFSPLMRFFSVLKTLSCLQNSIFWGRFAGSYLGRCLGKWDFFFRDAR
jgi:hypothetical protein